MDPSSILFKLLLSMGLGGLIGIDRERAHKGYPAGIRTLSFVSLLGTLTSFISITLNNPVVMPVVIGIMLFLFSVSYFVVSYTSKSGSLTSTVVIFLTYMIGLISYFEEYQYLAISLSIIITVVLTEKEILHDFARKMKRSELLDALKFGIVAFIILPLLPDRYVDPFHVINPHYLWLMVVLILTISFVAYVVSRLVGAGNGIFWSGAIGGLISSTAVSSSLSILSKKHPNLSKTCAKGILLASSIMYLRILFEIYIVNSRLAYFLFMPFLFSSIFGLFIASLVGEDKDIKSEEPFVEDSPFNFMPALKFTLILVVVMFISKFGNMLFGETGSYVASIFGGLVDTDAISVSVSSMAGSSLSYYIGFISILIATLSNNVVKLIIVRSMGSRKLFNFVLFGYIFMALPTVVFMLLALL